MYTISYHHEVVQDVAKISTADKKIIKNAIEKKLATDPLLFGKTLRKSLKNYRSLRVGNYRIIYKIEKKTYVKILAIGHRKDIYIVSTKRA